LRRISRPRHWVGLNPAQCKQIRELAELMIDAMHENQLVAVAGMLAAHIQLRKGGA
jgi:hypothetical protein